MLIVKCKKYREKETKKKGTTSTYAVSFLALRVVFYMFVNFTWIFT